MLSSICKKDEQYKAVIQECYLVKDAHVLLGGKMSKEGEKDGKEGAEGEITREELGIAMEWGEMRVGKKIVLIELLSELMKKGVEIGEEEELKEVLMELEEEGKKHVEEEKEGEEEGEKREWEELSEKAHQLAWMIEKRKNRREGKKSGTLKKIVQEKEEMEKKITDAEQRMEQMKVEMEGLKKEETLPIQKPSTAPPIIPYALSRSLDEIGVEFGDETIMRKENNSIIHNNEPRWVPAFVGGTLDNSLHRMFE